MISEKIENALNEQITMETYSSYLYWSMATWFDHQNLAGCANWMKKQAKEEWAHAEKLYGYIVERGGRVRLAGVKAPPHDWTSPLAIFEASYGHEQSVTKSIHSLVKLARDDNDPATEVFLHWFVNEQVEEEAGVDRIVQLLKKAKDSVGAMFYIDKELGGR